MTPRTLAGQHIIMHSTTQPVSKFIATSTGLQKNRQGRALSMAKHATLPDAQCPSW